MASAPILRSVSLESARKHKEWISIRTTLIAGTDRVVDIGRTQLQNEYKIKDLRIWDR